jgi:hypothetical protein
MLFFILLVKLSAVGCTESRIQIKLFRITISSPYPPTVYTGLWSNLVSGATQGAEVRRGDEYRYSILVHVLYTDTIYANLF